MVQRVGSAHGCSDWFVARYVGVSVISLQVLRVYGACGNHTINFFHLVGVSVSAKHCKNIVICFVRRNQDPAPKAPLLFHCLLFLHCLYIPSLPYLAYCLYIPSLPYLAYV